MNCFAPKHISLGLIALIQASTLLASPEKAEDAPQENASNPLAKVNNTDVRWQTFDTDFGTVNDIYIDGAAMPHDKLKIRYELHYWETNVSGQSENGWESGLVKAIYFPTEGIKGDVKYRVAVGCDWIVDLGDEDKGIGYGSDQIGPFAAVALGFKSKTMIIPLVQQFISYSGNSVNTTAFRLIALQPLPNDYWLKLDAKVPIEWDNNEEIPANFELQLGKDLNHRWAIYTDVLAGVGGDKPYDWGLGIAIRAKY